MAPRRQRSAADRGLRALQVLSFLDLPAATRCRAAPWAVVLAAVILAVMTSREEDEAPAEARRDGPGDGAAAAPAAGPDAARAEPWLGVTRRASAEQRFDEAMQPLRNLYRDMSVAMELHRDVDRMRGEAIQELRMEAARLKGTVLSHEDRIRQLGQAMRYAQNVANLLPNDALGAAGAGDDAAGGAGAEPGDGAGAGAAGEPPAQRRRLG